MFLDVMLRSPANSGTTKNLIVIVAAEILRGVYPERLDLSSSTGLAEGLRMTVGSFPMDPH